MRAFRSIIQGLAALRANDCTYFTRDGVLAPRASKFRHDLRGVVGGALALSFIAASVTAMFDIHPGPEGVVTLIAAVIGGISGKALLV